MSDAAMTGHGPIGPPEHNTSGRQGDVPTNPFMAALHRAATDDVEKRRNWLLGHADSATPASIPDPAALVDEIADLREKLAAAELRASEAENALPHLMELGQRTVDGLLTDARRRGREIIEASRRKADEEFAAEREEMRRETKELDSLRMAVAAEAMGLESVRAELQRRISRSADELHRMAEHPKLLGGELPVEDLALAAGMSVTQIEAAPASEPVVEAVREPQPLVEATDDFTAALLDATHFDTPHGDAPATMPPIGIVEASISTPASVEAQIEIAAEVDGVATVDVSGHAGPEGVGAPAGAAGANPGSRFAEAWAADEDSDVAEAFERFFSAEVEYEPSREWILADDTQD
jgi:hypothetical protein